MTTSTHCSPYPTGDLQLLPAPEDPELLLPHDHGDAQAEARAASSAAALLDETARGLLRVEGADAADLLQRILAGDVTTLESGALGENLLLTPKGRVRFSFGLERGEDFFHLVTSPGEAPALAQALDQFVFAEEVQFTDESSSSAPLDLLGPGVIGVLAQAGLGSQLAPGHWLALDWKGSPLRLSRPRVLGSDGWRLDAGPEQASDLWKTLVEAGATPIGLAAREALRVDRRVALTGRELPRDSDQGPYPQEALLNQAFSLTKGCYVGQEVVAKLDTYGGLNQALTAFSVGSSEPIAPGTPLLTEDGQSAGVVTTWCEPLLWERPALLANLKLRFTDTTPLFAGEGGPVLERIT